MKLVNYEINKRLKELNGKMITEIEIEDNERQQHA